jgi:hypothetical protein
MDTHEYVTTVTCTQAGFPCVGCSSSCQVFVAPNGTFSDGSGSASYRDNATCTWMIAPPGASQIRISFTEFSTEAGYDWVRLFSCNDIYCASKHLVAELTGTPGSVQSHVSPTAFMRVEFRTDSSVTRGGFTASWQSIVPVRGFWCALHGQTAPIQRALLSHTKHRTWFRVEGFEPLMFWVCVSRCAWLHT